MLQRTHKMENETGEHMKTNINTVALCMSQGDVQTMERTVPDLAEQIILNGCTET